MKAYKVTMLIKAPGSSKPLEIKRNLSSTHNVQIFKMDLSELGTERFVRIGKTEVRWRSFDILDLDCLRVSKKELASMMGIEGKYTYDTALPQHWLDSMARNHPDFHYHHILSTTFFVYVGSFGFPVSGSDDIHSLIANREYNSPPYTKFH